jgi:hypothetical protein
MRRHNMVQQFTGEPDPYSQGSNADDLGYDEVEFEIKSGKISVVVPSDTPDDAIWDAPRLYHINIEVEDGQVLQFEINRGDDDDAVV